MGSPGEIAQNTSMTALEPVLVGMVAADIRVRTWLQHSQ